MKLEIVEVIDGALQGFSNFIIGFFEVLGGNLNSATAEALAGFFLLCVCLRILNGEVKIKRIRRRRREEEEDDDYEYVRVRRR